MELLIYELFIIVISLNIGELLKKIITIKLKILFKNY